MNMPFHLSYKGLLLLSRPMSAYVEITIIFRPNLAAFDVALFTDLLRHECEAQLVALLN